MDRYEGKPLLKLLECYVVDAIGMLDEHQRELLRRMEPNLARTLHTQGTWQQIIAAHMEFPPSLPARIMTMWTDCLRQAEHEHRTLDPNEFVRTFVDRNFPIN